jgi:hypothetical protein
MLYLMCTTLTDLTMLLYIRSHIFNLKKKKNQTKIQKYIFLLIIIFTIPYYIQVSMSLP